MRTGILSLIVVALTGSAGCAAQRSPVNDGAAPAVRWLQPSEMKPTGRAPGAQHRLLASHEDGSQQYALILRPGDEVLTALTDFAKSESVTAASFTAIGAVRDPEVSWFDPSRKEYKGMKLSEQVEVLSLVGDVGLDVDGKPVVHAHAVLGRSTGDTFGGHLIGATVSPTLEVFVNVYPHPLTKKLHGETGLQLFDLSAPAR
jgi:predicted DNA-binding protein with PD1-like motif